MSPTPRGWSSICLAAGLTMFDPADGYSGGAAEEILGQAIRGRRDQGDPSTEGTFRSGPGPNDVGSSRDHLNPGGGGQPAAGRAPTTSTFISCMVSTP
jgi:hypothetical protein